MRVRVQNNQFDHIDDMDMILYKLSNYIETDKEYDEIIGNICSYYVKHDRHMYSKIANYINRSIDSDPQLTNYIQLNIKNIIDKVKNKPKYYDKILREKSGEYSEVKISLILQHLEKLYDHVGLETERIIFSDHIAENIQKEITLNTSTELRNASNSFNAKTEEIYKNLNANVITIVGIFSAIIFVFFGGISNLGSIISLFNSKDKLGYVIFSISFVGLVIFNVIFLLLYSISKMTDRNIGRYVSYKYEYMYIKNRYDEIAMDIYGVDDGNTKDTMKIKLSIRYKKMKMKLKYIFSFIYCKIYNSFILIGIRRYPFVIAINAFLIISMFISYRFL